MIHHIATLNDQVYHYNMFLRPSTLGAQIILCNVDNFIIQIVNNISITQWLNKPFVVRVSRQ